MASISLQSDLFQTIATAIDEGRPFALAVVLRSSGSVPREAGTTAIIDAEGSIHGTIGGGLLESEAQRLAVEALRTLTPVVFDFRFSGASAALNDPVCGGTMRILIDPTAARQRSAYIDASDAVRRRRRGVFLTTVKGHESPKIAAQWISDSEVSTSNFDAAALAMRTALAQGTAEFFNGQGQPEADLQGLARPVLPAARLLIAGGGHVGQALATQASLVGFEVIVVEDREKFADAALYPPGVTTRFGQFTDALEEFPIDQDTYVAVVGRGHPVDMKALAACIDKPAAYLGMMGSRRKVALVRKALLESGQATEEQFARVYAPIGMNIGAETVPEVAASIVAQLVAVRRTGKSPHFD
ncbi:MAG TPA: XdhC family protein [Pirellulales bacterium]|nr:XdhC family protein [Pirellulales bacterium]